MRPVFEPQPAARPQSAAVIARSLVVAVCFAFAGFVSAATLEVAVVDAAGKPLHDAVVMLEPTSGALPVRPLNGVQISQAHRQFEPQVTVVTVGTAVSFPNLDTVRHHVYSFSGVKNFELKLYSGVPAAPVVFDRPGIAVLGCNIHDQMVAWVVVVDTPFYGRTSATGKVTIGAVPPGAYRLKTWHSRLADANAPLARTITVGSADAAEQVTLRVEGARP